MATFFSYLRRHKLPNRSTLRTFLTPPLTWYGILLYTLIAAIAVCAYTLLLTLNNTALVTVPAEGGSLTEGVIGKPKFINPILATTDTDRSLVALTHSGLTRLEEDGATTFDLASDITISPDGKTYTVTLPKNAKWSDGKALTSDDIAFTFQKLANRSINPSSYWEAITIETPNPTTAIISLPEARNDFLARLSIGIMPMHTWSSVGDEAFATAKQNLSPVGSGPYKVSSIDKKDGDIQAIHLTRNNHYTGTRPYIPSYTLAFYANQTQLLSAIEKGDIDMTLAASHDTAKLVSNSGMKLQKIASQYTVSLYHHSGESILSNPKLVQILNNAVDKNEILAKVVNGYGILPSTPVYTLPTSPEEVIAELTRLGYTYRDNFLERNGQPVGFAIAVENDEVALLTAQTLASELSRFGLIVTVKAYDHGTFQDKLATREFQVFLSKESETIPSVYEPVLALYKEAHPFITTTDLRLPETLSSPLERYRYLSQWYVEYDRIWKFLYNIMNK